MSDWAPFATRRDGPPEKHGGYSSPEPHRKEGLVAHSMGGPLSAAMGELDRLSRRASWTFSNPQLGALIQHYPLHQDTWASGSAEANERFTSCEHEGGGPGNESEPLTENQIGNLVDLLRWLHDTEGWAGYQRLRELWEHHEAADAFGGGATSCPSGRIPWDVIMARLAPQEMEEDMAVVGQFAKSIPWDKSYVVTVGKEGARKTLVANAQEYESLVAAGFPTKVMPVADLRKIISSPGTPEP